MSSRDRCGDEARAGIRHKGSPRVRDEGNAAARSKGGERFARPRGLIVRMEGARSRSDRVSIQQNPRASGVLSENKVGFSQDAKGP